MSELGIEAAQLFREDFEPLLFGGERAIHEVLPLDRTEVLDQMLVFAAPEDKRAFGNTKLPGDTCEADALGAQLDKLLDCFLIFHFCVLRVLTDIAATEGFGP